VIRRNRLTILFWDLLFDALMRSGLIEVLDIGLKDTIQLLLLEDEKVIETLSPLYWLLGSSVRERGPWAFTARLFFVVR
jgi:hypothetical protein